MIKTLEKFELTGWEDKEDLKVFYTKLMTENKKNKKATKKVLVTKSARKPGKVKKAKAKTARNN